MEQLLSICGEPLDCSERSMIREIVMHKEDPKAKRRGEGWALVHWSMVFTRWTLDLEDVSHCGSIESMATCAPDRECQAQQYHQHEWMNHVC